MTTSTIEVSDDLALRLLPLEEHLPDLLSLAVSLYPSMEDLASPQLARESHSAWQMVLDFLVSGPSAAEIIAFRLPDAVEDHITTLFEKQAADTLSEADALELEMFGQLNHLLILLKAQARAKLN